MVKFKKEIFKIKTLTPLQTKKLGEILAKEILKTLPQKTIVLGLIGDLGGGKTTFLKGFAKGLGIKRKILSPTFIIFRKHKLFHPKSRTLNFKFFYHFDCYRIKKIKEILDLKWKEIISNPQNIIAIEWADRILKILPKDTLILEFKFINLKTREIIIRRINRDAK